MDFEEYKAKKLPNCGECSFSHCSESGFGFCEIVKLPRRSEDGCYFKTYAVLKRDALKIVSSFQKWRRGGKGKQPHPGLCGVAIDRLVHFVRLKERSLKNDMAIGEAADRYSHEKMREVTSRYSSRATVGDLIAEAYAAGARENHCPTTKENEK